MNPEDDEPIGELVVTQSGEQRVVFPQFEMATCPTFSLKEMREHRAKNGKYLVVYEEEAE